MTAVSDVPQKRLADFGSGPESYCPLCTGSDPRPKSYQDPNLLEHLYLDHDKPALDIADLYGRSTSTIKNWLQRHDITKSPYRYEMPEEDLHRLYREEAHTIQEVADHFGCSRLAVRNRLQIHGIEIRSTAEVLADPDDDSYRDEDWLREKYHEEELSKQVIADHCGVTESTIQHWMNKFGIEARDLSDAQRARNERRDEPYMDEERLRELYWERGLTQREMADRLDCSQLAVQNWMNHYDIQLRYAGAHGATYETSRGEFVRSAAERQIANWLYEQGVDYEYEPDLDGISLQPDFAVGGDLIEFWGMLNREEYVDRMHEKLRRYRGANINLVNLFPHDLDDLAQKLARYV
jgi:transposase